MSDNKRNLSELEKKLKFIQGVTLSITLYIFYFLIIISLLNLDYLDNGNPKKALSEVEKLIKVYETSNRPQVLSTG